MHAHVAAEIVALTDRSELPRVIFEAAAEASRTSVDSYGDLVLAAVSRLAFGVRPETVVEWLGRKASGGGA